MKQTFIHLFFFLAILKGQDWAGQSGGFLRMGMTARSIAMGGGVKSIFASAENWRCYANILV